MKKENNITIHDIAKALNISGSTVSRALNNNTRISEKTKKAVRDKAKELGYQPNALASNLRTSCTNTIGVIIPRISRYFFSSAITGIEEFAREKGFNVIICQSNDLEARESDCVQTLFASRVDGVISSVALKTNNYEHYKTFTNRNIPLVFFDRVCDELETSKVVVDDFKGGFIAAEHLISKGCKRIAHISGPQHLNIYINRLQGYLKALRKHDITVDQNLILESPLTREDGLRCAKELLESSNPPDAIFAGNDTTALSIILYAKEKGIRIPEDLAIMGFSNEPFSEYLSPSLTTVEQSGFDVGIKATELLIDIITNKSGNTQETIVLPVKLIERESTNK
ncbi:substrate-binding domain-containing protein [Marinifilum sp. N1E240]|uniref:LacI family DNA-binding transcriptional regulator n=1 Tax=Marinifilum sp. N1E240 TaxID=2608082 RepID=UPI00128E3922|nr:LacI family DNA-binding transcriptional regulator [Marinifilum sp. N1E240]MPQ47230.1 substrate-binding domain-containing protein [Marinifilum sp. N1E240]